MKTPQQTASRTVVVSNPEGLHARAATQIAQVVRGFRCEVRLSKDRDLVSATDVLQLLSLGAGQGEELLLEATGSDAHEALDALVELFATDFGVDKRKKAKP